MKIISLLGGPGTGKSTTAAGLFYEMKKAKLNVELVTEYAKDIVWENRMNLLDDQIYIFAKQHRRISRLQGHGLDWVITDSPFMMGLVYLKDGALPDSFESLVIEMYSKYTNYNFLLQRNFEYNPIGRNQKDVKEAEVFDRKITALLQKWSIPYDTILGGESAVMTIMDQVVKEVNR